MALKKNNRVLLMTSYCDLDDEDCTDGLPCADCLDMCNVFTLNQDCEADYVGEYQRLQEDAILKVPQQTGEDND